MELPRYDIRVHMAISAPERTLQRGGRMDASASTCLSHVLLDPRARVHGYVGVQAVAGGCDDQGSCECCVSGFWHVANLIDRLKHRINCCRQSMDNDTRSFLANGRAAAAYYDTREYALEKGYRLTAALWRISDSLIKHLSTQRLHWDYVEDTQPT